MVICKIHGSMSFVRIALQKPWCCDEERWKNRLLNITWSLILDRSQGWDQVTWDLASRVNRTMLHNWCYSVKRSRLFFMTLCWQINLYFTVSSRVCVFCCFFRWKCRNTYLYSFKKQESCGPAWHSQVKSWFF